MMISRLLTSASALALLTASAWAQSLPSPQVKQITVGGQTITGVGTGTGTVAAGNDNRITGALQLSNALSELAAGGSQAAARANLGLGTAATQNVGPGGVASYGDACSISGGTDCSGAKVTATGGTVAQTEAARAASLLTVHDFGAVGDGMTDDSAAFNRYATYLRSLTGYGKYRGFNLGNSKVYAINNSVNFTSLNNTTVDMHGSTLVGNTPGYAILDAVQSVYLTFRNGTIISGGSASSCGANAAIQVGRMSNGYSGAVGIQLDNVLIDGFYCQAGYINRAAEVSLAVNPNITNRYTGGGSYGVIEDGLAVFQLASKYQTDALYGTSPATSFNTTRWIGGSISNNGSGPAVWEGGYRDHRFTGTFVGVSDGTSPAGLIYTTPTSEQVDLGWEVHSENPQTSDLQIVGTATSPVLNGLTYRNNTEMSPSRVIAMGGSVTSATIHNLDLFIGEYSKTSTLIFDQPAAYIVDGAFRVPTVGPWNLAAPNFRGIGSVNGAIAFYGTIDASSALPSTLSPSSITSYGSVSAIMVTGGTSAINAYPGGTIPAMTIDPPASGGGQATAAVSEVGLWGTPSSGGVKGTTTGYVNNDVVTIASSYGCKQSLSFKAVVSNGTVTGIGSNATIGDCPASLMTNSSINTTGGSGTGLQIDGTAITWRVQAATVTGGGSKYGSNPNVTFATSALPAKGTVSLTSQLTMASGSGQVLLNSSGTFLGVTGASGSPTISQGALIDGSGVRVAISGNYTVPGNASLVRFTQTSNVTSTVTLPTALGDGQPIQFVNQGAGAVTLTFSPAVQGWTNGSTLAAGPGVGLRIRWDATATAWFREQ